MNALAAWVGLPTPEGERFHDMLGAVLARASLIEVATLCIGRWSGVGDEQGNDVPVTRPWVAMLLRDAEAASAIGDALGAAVHQQDGLTIA